MVLEPHPLGSFLVYHGLSEPFLFVPVVHDDEATDAFVRCCSDENSANAESKGDPDEISCCEAKAPVAHQACNEREYICPGSFEAADKGHVEAAANLDKDVCDHDGLAKGDDIEVIRKNVQGESAKNRVDARQGDCYGHRSSEGLEDSFVRVFLPSK